ncbi:endonuclease domain-containing protein [Streptomyces sp. NPDC001276]|uniref:endonuclease domain-containing protein n=1 Tax=Streptomyces sp. NPDC001276 TaxID=3364555 RepID=UPI0036C5A54E
MERKPLRELVDEGVLLTSRALAAGWPRRSLTLALRAQGWIRLYAGAWAEPGSTPTLATRLRAVQLVRPRLVAGHGSAAALLLERAEVVEGLQGLRFTSARRTLTDLLRAGPRDDAIVAVDSALGYRKVDGARRPPLTDMASVEATLKARSRGTARARTWLLLCDPRAGSPAETIARLRLHDAGLHPESQAEIITPAGRRVRLDFLFREAGLAVEIEGYAYHGTRDSHRQDIARFNQVLQCPEVRSLLRFTAEDVFHRPSFMIEQIRTALFTSAK